MAAAVTGRDRRGAPRSTAPGFGIENAAVVRPGLAVSVVTISPCGALVESAAPIRPGNRTELTLDAFDGRRWPVGVEVLRCWVATLDPVRYRAAMRFETPEVGGVAGKDYPEPSRCDMGSVYPRPAGEELLSLETHGNT